MATNDYAYPRAASGPDLIHPAQNGMTILDVFAISLVQGHLASGLQHGGSWADIVSDAYDGAEAMLKERAKRG